MVTKPQSITMEPKGGNKSAREVNTITENPSATRANAIRMSLIENLGIQVHMEAVRVRGSILSYSILSTTRDESHEIPQAASCMVFDVGRGGGVALRIVVSHL